MQMHITRFSATRASYYQSVWIWTKYANTLTRQYYKRSIIKPHVFCLTSRSKFMNLSIRFVTSFYILWTYFLCQDMKNGFNLIFDFSYYDHRVNKGVSNTIWKCESLKPRFSINASTKQFPVEVSTFPMHIYIGKIHMKPYSPVINGSKVHELVGPILFRSDTCVTTLQQNVVYIFCC